MVRGRQDRHLDVIERGEEEERAGEGDAREDSHAAQHAVPHDLQRDAGSPALLGCWRSGMHQAPHF